MCCVARFSVLVAFATDGSTPVLASALIHCRQQSFLHGIQSIDAPGLLLGLFGVAGTTKSAFPGADTDPVWLAACVGPVTAMRRMLVGRRWWLSSSRGWWWCSGLLSLRSVRLSACSFRARLLLMMT